MEQVRGTFDEDAFTNELIDDDVCEVSKQLYQTLTVTTGGAAKTIVMTTKFGHGFRA